MKHPSLSRRNMLQWAAGMGAACLVSPALAAAQARVGPQSGGFKIGVCDWMTGTAGPDALRWAKALGIDGVQVSFGEPGGKFDLRQSEVRDLYSKTAKETGVAVASMALGVLNNIPYKSDLRTEQWVSEAIDVCQAMDLRVILLAFFSKDDLIGDAAGTQETINRLKKIAPKAEKAGVYLGIESWLSAEDHIKIMDAVGSPNVMMYYDVGNSTKMGYDICKEIRRLGKNRICEFHAKDYAAKGFGLGDIDFWAVRQAMDDIGYRGWIHLEGPTPYGREKTYRHDRDYLKSVFPPNA